MAINQGTIDYDAINAAPASRKELIILAAAATIDFSSCATLDEVETVLLKRIITMQSFIYPNSVEMRLLDSVKIPATIKSITYEKSSTRFIIKYVADNGEEEETVRSDRTDHEDGERVKKLWQGLEGRHVVIYKMLEQTDKLKKPSVRVAPYVRVLKN